MLSTGGSYPWIAMPSVEKHVLTRRRLCLRPEADTGPREQPAPPRNPKKLILGHAGLVGEFAARKIRQHATHKPSILGHAGLVGEVGLKKIR